MLAEINNLLSKHGIHPVTASHLTEPNVIELKDGKVIGFIWMGLMAEGTIGYIDKFVVHPDYRAQGVGYKLAQSLLECAKELGVKEVFGYIKQDENHDASGMNALKMALASDKGSYTHVFGQIEFITKELGDLNGR